MKKFFKTIILLTVTSLILLAAFSCSVISPLPDYAGDALKVDKSTGYFKEDITYKIADGSNTWEWNFYADGRYDYTQKTWDSIDEAWEQTAGKKGTYSWDPETLLLTQTYTEDWDSVEEQYSERTDYPNIRKFEAYFTSINWYGTGSVYKLDENIENQWTNTYLSTYDDEWEYSDTESITVDVDSSIYSGESSYISKFEGDETYKEEEETNGSIENIFPEGTKFKRGNTITVYVSIKTKDRTWDPALDWSEWSTFDVEKTTITLLHMGDFVIVNPSNTALRGFEK